MKLDCWVVYIKVGRIFVVCVKFFVFMDELLYYFSSDVEVLEFGKVVIVEVIFDVECSSEFCEWWLKIDVIIGGWIVELLFMVVVGCW